MSKAKLVPPATKVICLGIEIDTVARTIAIPREKLDHIIRLCNNWNHKLTCRRRDFQSLLGSLLYIGKCCPPSRIFLNRMLTVFREHFDKNTIPLTVDFYKDLKWFRFLLKEFNGTSFYQFPCTNDIIELDACLTGLGGRCGLMVYHLPIIQVMPGWTIVHLEMVNIMVATKIWSAHWANKRISIKCDNQAVVQVLNSSRTRDPILATIMRNVWMLAAKFNINMSFVHVMGIHNPVGDLLSRWDGTPRAHTALGSLLPNFEVVYSHQSLLHMNTDI